MASNAVRRGNQVAMQDMLIRPSVPPRPFAKFNINWEITTSQFQDISTEVLTKRFPIAYNNLVLYVRLEITPGKEAGKISLKIIYDKGPVATFKYHFKFGIGRETTFSYEELPSAIIQAKRGGSPHVVENFASSDLEAFQKKYRLASSNPTFIVQFVMETPPSLFISSPDFFLKAMVGQENQQSPSASVKLFNNVQAPESKYSDVRLISKDGTIFYCHRNILATQCHVFDAMFRNASTEEELQGIFRFPTFNKNILNAVLKFIYTETLINYSLVTQDLIGVVDFGEQYGLEDIKRLAVQSLWSMAVRRPEDCVEIARFADVHEDLQFLKNRCFDVLVEKYEVLSLKTETIFQTKPGVEESESVEPAKKKMKKSDLEDQATRLREEFFLYGMQRVSPTFQWARNE